MLASPTRQRCSKTKKKKTLKPRNDYRTLFWQCNLRSTYDLLQSSAPEIIETYVATQHFERGKKPKHYITSLATTLNHLTKAIKHRKTLEETTKKLNEKQNRIKMVLCDCVDGVFACTKRSFDESPVEHCTTCLRPKCAIMFAFLCARARAGNDHIAAQVIKFAYQQSAIALAWRQKTRKKAWKGNGSLTQILSTHFFFLSRDLTDRLDPDALEQSIDAFKLSCMWFGGKCHSISYRLSSILFVIWPLIGISWIWIFSEMSAIVQCDISQRKLQLPPSRDKI